MPKYEQKKAYFFPDEPEGDISKYSGNMRVCDDGMKDAEYTGYYERVKDGEGTFVQKIVKGEDGKKAYRLSDRIMEILSGIQ